MFPPILSHLGFNELATTASSPSEDAASGPTDSSLLTCFWCSVPSLLREHLVPGLFTIQYLRQLAFGTKIETLSLGRCITITSSKSQNDTVSKVLIGGVDITRPDLFSNGIIVIHRIQGNISPLPSFSCQIQRMTSLLFPFQPSDHGHHHRIETQPPIMTLMLQDAMLRLQNRGFGMLSLVMKVNYKELITLTTKTLFAFDDASIFSGSYTYISNVRHHKQCTTLPKLEKSLSLTVTTFGVVTGPLRIEVLVPDVMNNLNIVVYGVNLPFPHFGATAFDADSMGVTETDGGEYSEVAKSAASAGTNTVPNSLLTAVTTCSAMGAFAWSAYKMSKMSLRSVELKQQPEYFPIRCSSREHRSRKPVGRNRSAVRELYERYSVVKLKEAFDAKYEVERRFKEIVDCGTKQTKRMKKELRTLKSVVTVAAIDIGTSDVGVALFSKRFDELDLRTGETKMLDQVLPSFGFPRHKNKDFISRLVKQQKPDIFVVGNAYGNDWKNTEVEIYVKELRTYEEMRGKAITLGDEKHTSQMVNFLEGMECKGLLNLRQMVEEMKIQPWEEMEPYRKDVESARIILARALCEYLGYKDPRLSVFDG